MKGAETLGKGLRSSGPLPWGSFPSSHTPLPAATGDLKTSTYLVPATQILPPRNCSLDWSLADFLKPLRITDGLMGRALDGKSSVKYRFLGLVVYNGETVGIYIGTGAPLILRQVGDLSPAI